MPKYSTVQAYSDNSANVQTVSYEQASGSGGGSSSKGGAVRPEKVVNPYGSTAGANSGDFHLYRQTRAREMERMKQMTEEEKERQKDLEFQNKLKKDREEEERKTDKKRKKRQRHKEAKMRRKMLAKAGIKLDNPEEDSDEGDFDDFAVPAPEEKETKDSNTTEDEKERNQIETGVPNSDVNPAPPFPNDGSFLEMMKKQMESQNQTEN